MRAGDVAPFHPTTSFVARLHQDLTARGFEVWFDRMAMQSRGPTFHQGIQDAVAACEHLVLVVAPRAALSGYVRQKWQSTFQSDKAVTAIARQRSPTIQAKDECAQLYTDRPHP